MNVLTIDEDIEDLESIGQLIDSPILILKLAHDDARVFGTMDLKVSTLNDVNGLIEHLYARQYGVSEKEATDMCITEKPCMILASLVTGQQAVMQYVVTQ